MKKVALFACAAMAGVLDAAAQAPITFNAKGLVVISDADMAASALADGKLLRDNAAKDQLTAIKFPIERGSKGVGSALVSNSALTYGKTLTVAPAGNLAFVLESRLRPEDGVAEYKDVNRDFPAGEKLFVVDVSNPAAPKAKFGFPVGKKPAAIDVNKNELILSTAEPGKELVFIEAAPDGKPSRFLNLPAGIDSASKIIDVSWHPSGDYIAFTLDNTSEVGLYRVIREGGKLKNVELVGKPVKVGTRPGLGRFSADGKHYFVLDTKSQPGKGSASADIYVVDFSMDGAVEHKVAGQAAAGLNTGGMAISPDGTLLVAVNSGKSNAAWSEAGAGSGASLTLFKVAKADGTLTKIADYPFEGIYPQSVAFDKDGSNLAVSVFEYLEYGNGNGGVEFWTVTKGEAPALKKQGARVSVAKGAHTLRIIP